MRKKLFTFLLALAASVGMMWAQGPWNSGDCTLTLSNGVMTVSGSGAMGDNTGTPAWESASSTTTSIVIGDGVTYVGAKSFGSYYYTTTLTLGNSVERIGNYAFSMCIGLTAVEFPSTLQTIGASAFNYCQGLTSLSFPAGLLGINDYAFSSCTGLTSVTCAATTPPTLGTNVFNNVNTANIPLYVPAGSVEAYQAAAQWNAFDIQGYDPAPASTPNSIVINGTPAVGDNSISLTYYFDPANVPGITGYAPTLKVKCVEDGKYDEMWLSLSEISSGTTTITLDELGSFQAGKSYEVCFAYYNGSWVDEMFQSFSFDAPTPTPSATGGIFANCYDCQRDPAFPTKSESCVLSDFDWPMVGNNSSIGPWKIEFVEYYNSSSTEYDFSINSDLAELYEKTPEQMEIYRLYQWNESAGEYQHAAYGVLCAYANESNPVEHAALFVADGRWGCYLTGEVHNGGSINITFDEDASTGFADLHPAPAPAGNSITINESSYGSVVASSSSAAAGETITLTATPGDGYQLKSISGVYETQATSSETLNATSETVNGNKFQAQATSRNLYGWRVYNPGTANTLTISSKDGATLIEKIEFTSTFGNGRTNDMLSVSAGTRSFDGSDPSTTVTINDINATSITISGSGNNAAKTWCISSVKVYYTATIENELEISDTENANVKTFTMVDSEVTISAEFEPAPAPTPSGDGDKLSGAFSVDASKVIYFSKGNLQYTGSWQFAANQWDVIGASQTDDNRDLFSWGTGDAPNWENNMGGDWRTLTKDEWKYLFLTRDNAATLFALGNVNGKKGVILLPDAWVLPDGASFNASSENGFEKMGSTYYDDDYTNDHFQDNTYTTEQWAVMESAGAVFLPAAGYRESSNSNIYYVGEMGYYWSATPNGDEAYYISFSSEYLGTQNYNPRNDGRSVRLVSETAPGPAPTPTDEQVPTNADPVNPSYHYSTFFHSTQNYKLTNDGTQAFIADLSGSDLVLTMIAEGTQVIPANTAVILRKTGSADPVVLTPTEENGVSVNPDENSLEGVDVATPLTDIDGLTATNCYVLSGKSHDETVTGVGFYRIYGNTLKAHKAYVKYVGLQQNAPRRMRFVFNTATGIDEITNDQSPMTNKILRDGQLIILKNGVMYNAMGQMVK